MNHLSSEQVLSLSDKLMKSMAFSKEEERALLHIASCEECFHFLCSVIAVNQLWSVKGSLMTRELTR